MEMLDRNDELEDQFDDCLSFDADEALPSDSFYPEQEDLYLARRHSLAFSMNSILNSRRFSMFGMNNIESDVPMESMTPNEYQECFEHFSSGSINGTNQAYDTRQPIAMQDPYQSSETTTSNPIVGDLNQRFQQSLFKLEELMKRSEQSRMMLGAQERNAAIFTNGGSNTNSFTGSYAKPRSQLLSYVSQLGNNTFLS